MNEKYSEQIIDSFLEELLTNQTPPDLSVRIADAWELEQGLVRATPVRVPPTGKVAAPRPGVNLSATHKKLAGLRRKRKGASFRRNLIAALLALSACGLLAFLGARLIVKQQLAHSTLAIESESLSTGEPDAFTNGSSVIASNAEFKPKSAVASSAPASVESINLDDLPFATDASSGQQDAGVAGENSLVRSPLATPQTLSDDAIVLRLDQQLTQLWQTLKIVPTAKLSAGERAKQIAVRLTGDTVSPVVSSAINSQLTSRELSEIVNAATDSPAFARLWAEKLTKAWFGRGSVPLDDPRIAASVRRITDFIDEDKPFNHIAVELLGSEIQDATIGPETKTAEPPSTTSTFVSALAGNGNHRLVARIGVNFLDTNLACVRCHEANPASQDSVVNQHSSSAKQQVYWSLVALLQGIEVQGGNGRQRIAIDRQAQRLASGKPLEAYFDLLDGRLQAAQPLLPDGQSWEQVAAKSSVVGPRRALAAWLAQSTAMDEAIVNQVWKFVFGRPLVSQVPWQTADAGEQLATQTRRELQLFLADQYRSHDYDLKRLIAWIVRSDAFSRHTLEMNRSQWLNASDDELRQLQLAELNFATGPSQPLGAEASSLESSLAAVLKWQGQNETLGANPGETTLAQPTPVLPTSEKDRRKLLEKQARDSTLPSLSYALHGELPSPRDAQLVSRLLASRRLSWEQRVMHIVLLNPDNAVNGRVKHLADELLRKHSGDARSALFDLLWAVQNSDSI